MRFPVVPRRGRSAAAGLSCLVLSAVLVAQDPTPADRLRDARRLSAQGKHAEAEAVLTDLVKQTPTLGPAWLQLGSARHAQKKWEAALEAHLKAAEFPAVKPTALYNAACVYALQKQPEKALDTLGAAVAAGFADRGQMLADPDLDGVRADKRFAPLVPKLLAGNDLFTEPTRILHTFTGEGANHQFGWVARKVGDVDGDKVTDFVTTAPAFGRNAGKVYVYSSRTGKLLFSTTGEPGQQFGNGAAGAGDVNADGTPDVIVGGPGGDTALVLSGKGGSVLLTLRGEKPNTQFGYKVSGIGDVTGDGHADVAVTAPAAAGGQPGSGRVYGFSGKDGTRLFTLDGEATGDKFGSAVAGTESATHPMLAVGAQDAGPGDRGRVSVYRFEKGQPVLAFRVDAPDTGRDLGQMFLSFPGDLNADGVPDVYCSDFSDSAKAPGAGRVFVYSGKDGKKLLDLTGNFPGEGFGTSPSDAGDVNGDGIGDLIIGAWQNREKAASGGKVYLHSGADGKLLAAWTCRQPGDTFGFDATGLGDVDGDGRVDFLLTSAWSPAVGPKCGRVFIVAGPELPKK